MSCVCLLVINRKLFKTIRNKKRNFLEILNFPKQKNKQKKIKFKNSYPQKVWCASSTHYPEEIICAKVHNELKKKYKNLFTIIIPRHVNRVNSIKSELIKENLNVHINKSQDKINNNTDIYV